MIGAVGNLLPGEFNLSSGVVSAIELNGPGAQVYRPVARGIEVLAGGAMSSAFWAAPIVELPSKLEFAAAKAALTLLPPLSEDHALEDGLETPNRPTGPAAGGVYAFDGGFVDTSGVTILLRRRVDRMVVMLNKNSDLREVNSTLAYLFGVATPTDTMNTLEGPALAQVFVDSQLFDGVIANLTDGARLFASLSDVRIKQNDYFGVSEYVASKILFISNQFSEEFIGEFAPQSGVKQKVDPRWPNKFEIGMSTFDANLMCVFAGWKVSVTSRIVYFQMIDFGSNDGFCI